MSAPALSNVSCRHSKIQDAPSFGNRQRFASLVDPRLVKFTTSRPFGQSQVRLNHCRRESTCCSIRMAYLDEKLADRSIVLKPADVLAYDLVQGADVRWSYISDKSAPEPPTAVLLHGILGCRKNWGTFARRLAKEFPKWQFLLVDLRCHGDSASLKKRGPHSVASAALDVLKLLGQMRLTPRVVVGHSFGGKVALSMVDQVAKPLARPVRVWVLDATPGNVRAGADGDDHPAELISFLSTLPEEVSSKRGVMDALVQNGFSKDVAQWVVTNLRQTPINGSSSSCFSWVFDLKGISEMYQSYEETNMWKIVEDVPRGVHINFLKAERSLHRWALEDLRRIHVAEEQAAEEGGGVEMHVLEDAGHWRIWYVSRREVWHRPQPVYDKKMKKINGKRDYTKPPAKEDKKVHADNPDGLFRILSFSFQGF